MGNQSKMWIYVLQILFIVLISPYNFGDIGIAFTNILVRESTAPSTWHRLRQCFGKELHHEHWHLIFFPRHHISEGLCHSTLASSTSPTPTFWQGSPPSTSPSVGVLTPIPLRLSLGRPGSMGPVHPKDDVRPSQPDRSPAQGVKADLAIKQDPGRLE